MSEKNMDARTGADNTVVANCFCVKCGRYFDGVIGRFTSEGPSVCPKCEKEEEDKRLKTDTAKIEIIVTWKGHTMKRTREGEWWSKLSTEEILNEVELAIDRIEEEVSE